MSKEIYKPKGFEFVGDNVSESSDTVNDLKKVLDDFLDSDAETRKFKYTKKDDSDPKFDTIRTTIQGLSRNDQKYVNTVAVKCSGKGDTGTITLSKLKVDLDKKNNRKKNPKKRSAKEKKA